MYRLFITVLALALSGGTVSHGQEAAELVDIPVAFAVDGNQSFSGMAFSLERVDYDNIRFEDIEGKPASPEVEAFFALVKALQSGSVESVLALSDPTRQGTSEDRRNFVKAYQAAFADQWDRVELKSRYDHSGRSTFIWQIPSETGPYVRSFAMSGRDGGFSWVESMRRGHSNLMDTLLIQSEQLMVEGRTFTLPEEFRFSQRIPESEFFVKFNGLILHWDVFGSTRPDLPVAEVYREAFTAFKAGDFETFASFYTPESATKFLNWINDMPAEELEAYYNEVIAGREVRFILDADPFYAIYYNTPDGVSYDVIHREGETFRLTGFYINSFIDKLLRDRNFFIVPVIARITQQDDDPVEFVPVDTGTDAATQLTPTIQSQESSTEELAPEESEADGDIGEPFEPSGESRPLWPWMILGIVLVVLFTFLKLRKSHTS